MRFIAKLKQSLSSIPKIDRVLFVIAIFLLCAPFAQFQKLVPPPTALEGTRMHDARQLIDDLQSSDYQTMLAACERAGTVHRALIRAADLNFGNKMCILEMDARVTATMYKLTVEAGNTERKYAALIGWGNIVGHEEARQNPLVDEALYSDDLDLLRLAIPLAPVDVGSRDATFYRFVELARIPECQLPILQRLRPMLKTNGYPWNPPVQELVDLVHHLEDTGNLEVRLEAKAVSKQIAAELKRSADAAAVSSADRAIAARAEKLANIETSLNTLANFMEALGILWGVPTMLVGCASLRSNMTNGIRTILYGLSGMLGGLATPGCINWLVASAHDPNNFSGC